MVWLVKAPSGRCRSRGESVGTEPLARAPARELENWDANWALTWADLGSVSTLGLDIRQTCAYNRGMAVTPTKQIYLFAMDGWTWAEIHNGQVITYAPTPVAADQITHQVSAVEALNPGAIVDYLLPGTSDHTEATAGAKSSWWR